MLKFDEYLIIPSYNHPTHNMNNGAQMERILNESILFHRDLNVSTFNYYRISKCLQEDFVGGGSAISVIPYDLQ